MSSRPSVGRGHRPDVGDSAAAVTGDGRHLGRHATTPLDIPAKGWWQVARRVWREAREDQISMAAASCGFFALLALFPALSILISLYGLILDPAAVETQLEVTRDFLPPAAYGLIAQRLHDLVTQPAATLGWSLLLSVLAALWSTMSGTKAIMAALNIAYEQREKRSVLRLNGMALILTLSGVIGVSIALSIIVGLPALISLAWLGPLAAIALRLVSWALLAAFLVAGLAALYRFGPSREAARLHWLTPGSIAAALVWLVASALFSSYVANFGSYDVAYGSLGAVVVAMLWFYISAYVVILGAELNAELELQTARDTTVGPERDMGDRGAFVADHVAGG